MNKTCKQLRTDSLLVLIYTAVMLIKFVVDLITGDHNNAVIPADAPENILMITNIILSVVIGLFLLPRVYVGIKGLRVAKNPNTSKGHIVWSVIILVFLALEVIFAIIACLQQGGFSENIHALTSSLVEIAIYSEFVRNAIAVRKENLVVAE